VATLVMSCRERNKDIPGARNRKLSPAGKVTRNLQIN
jgi:hypothetical protein